MPIIGGRFKGGDLRLLREPLRRRAKAVVAIGEARPLVRDALARRRAGARGRRRSTRRSHGVRAGASRQGVVLLAPACASFDMFRDYAERGRKFKEEVGALKPDGSG